MRKLLYLTLGVALLSAPAAFAQTQTPQPSPPPGAVDSQGNMIAPAPPEATQPLPAPPDQSMAPGQTIPPSATAPQPSGETGAGARLYTSETQVNGQQLQVISNAPVPDTKATRAKYRPLSALGRRTRAAGN
jgi:hypothetical protein